MADKENYIIIRSTKRGKETLSNIITPSIEDPDSPLSEQAKAWYEEMTKRAKSAIKENVTPNANLDEHYKILLKELPKHVKVLKSGKNEYVLDFSKCGEGYGGAWLCSYNWILGKGKTLSLYNIENPKVQVKDCPLDGGEIFSRVSDALNEASDPANVKSFDLPRNRPIGYLAFNGMMDKENRGLHSKNAQLLYAFPEMLSACGYKMVCANEERVTSLKKVADVEGRIAELYKSGVRDFYLNFLAHGDIRQMNFYRDESGRSAGVSLRANDVKEILKKYSDCTFAIQTSACHGGGLIGMMQGFEDSPDAPKNRVAVFTMTKESSSNIASLVSGHKYERQLINFMSRMADRKEGAPKTYGEAHLKADKNAKFVDVEDKKNHDVNPEAWLSQPGKPSKSTAKLDSDTKSYFAFHTMGAFPVVYSPSSETNAPISHGLPNVFKKNGKDMSWPTGRA